jgi:hypothetical protein
MLRLVRTLLIWLIVTAFDWYQSLKGRVMLALGRDKIIYSATAGELAEQPTIRRAAIVAIYPENDNLPFLANLLRALAASNFYIMVVSTKRLTPQFVELIKSGAHFLIERYPIGRDFGSYKIGMEWLFKNKDCTELTELMLANDSLYYPNDIDKTIGNLLATEGSWVGLYENFEFHYHMQSFLVLYRTAVLKSQAFKEFWKKYRLFPSRRYSINKGEVGLSRVLTKASFSPNVLYSSVILSDAVEEALKQDKFDPTLNFLLNSSGVSNIFEQMAAREALDDDEQENASGGKAGLKREKAELLAEKRKPLVVDKNQWQEDRISKSVVRIAISRLLQDLARRVETKNPTHRVGLLANYLVGAPIKRDICSQDRGDGKSFYSIADVFRYARGYSVLERDAMVRDLRRRGTPVSKRGLKGLLFRRGRI